MRAPWWSPAGGSRTSAAHEADTEVYGSTGYRRIWAREQPPGYVHCDVTLFIAQLRDAMAQIAAWQPGTPSPRNGLEALRICELAYASAGVGSEPCRLTGRSASPASPAVCAAPPSIADCCGPRWSRRPEGMTIEPLEIRDLPHYDADLDVEGGPEIVREFKARIIAADGLLLATPEYNYSMSGVLKNALDWASRAPERAMQNKPVAIMGATPGRWGTVRSQMALRQMLVFPGCRVLPSPLLQIAGAREHFDADGNLTDALVREQVVSLLEAFATWIRQVELPRS